MNRNEKKTTVLIDPQNATELLYGIQQLCTGMNEGAFGRNVEYVCSDRGGQTAEQNALDFLMEHYNSIAGTFRMIGAAADILCDAIENDDLQLVAGEAAATRGLAMENTPKPAAAQDKDELIKKITALLPDAPERVLTFLYWYLIG